MYLFIDTISNDWALIIFDDHKIIAKTRISLKWKEFDNLLEKIDEFLKDNNLAFKDLSWITVINWPWSFTWTRVVVLIVNTLFYVYNFKIEAIDYFTFMELSWAKYPFAIKANKNEYLVKIDKKTSPLIKTLDEVSDWEYFWIWDNIDFENKDIYIKFISEYENFFNAYDFSWKNSLIQPLYIKKPNIT
ncbi:MAG: hypothetical protein ACD_4C00171G0004 [uncultured bacterium (gcode 4)]|uniref:Gcp-like domain-containing protein n=1 Tax=uncultured bacterium (gcode 4) TaxID=1234023 RepID=K2GTR6_9BACT|nr:MAG: hypothetical protein ACD_4C00171G0004 [uncultured bacterium (gcode 4)]